MEYDQVAIEKAEQKKNRKELEENYKQRYSRPSIDPRTPSHVPRTTMNTLAVIREDQEELQNSDDIPTIKPRPNIKTLTEIQQDTRRKAEKLGIEKTTLIKSTNRTFYMTCNLGLGINARLGMEKELRNNKKGVKSLSSVMFSSSAQKSSNLIEKLQIYKGLENFSGISSNIFQNCINGSKFSDKYYESLSVDEREKLNELIESFKKKTSGSPQEVVAFQNSPNQDSPRKDKAFTFDPRDVTSQKDFQNFGRTIFETRNSEDSLKNTIRVYPQNILFQNIDSYLGGQKDFWRRATEKSDIISNSKDQILIPGSEQSSSDGKLELLSFTEGVKTGIWGKILNKKPHRISQSKIHCSINFLIIQTKVHSF